MTNSSFFNAGFASPSRGVELETAAQALEDNIASAIASATISTTDALNAKIAAGTSATAAAGSASAAAGSASAAATSASNAASSATTAGTHASNSAGAAGNAQIRATNAATSASNAASSATSASSSASAAATSASNAAASATAAATSATNAATSASNATSSASAASASAASATSSASAAAASADAAAATAAAFTPFGAKAWAVFNGSSLLNSRGISSITDHGIGDVTFAFSTPFSNNNYAAIGTASYLATDGATLTAQPRFDTGQYAASSCRFVCAYMTGTNGSGVAFADPSRLSVVFFGD